MQMELSTEPVTNGRLFFQSLKLYGKSVLRVFPLALLLSLIIFIPQVFHFYMRPHAPYFLSIENILTILIIFMAIGVFIAMLWRIWEILNNVQDSFLDDFKIAGRKVWIVILAAILQALIFSLVIFTELNIWQTFLSSLFLKENFYIGFYIIVSTTVVSFILTCYLYLLFFFYIPLILTENAGILVSLQHSAQLVFRHASRVFWLQISPWVFYFVVLIVLRYALLVNVQIFGLESMREVSIVATLINILLFSLFIPWVGAMLLVQLHDLEIRKQFNV
jgi:hypothetical protein